MDLRKIRLLGGGRILRPLMTTAIVSALLVPVASRAAATTTTSGQRVDVTINVPAMVLENTCNGDSVALSGDMHIVTVTRPTSNGGYTVTSTAAARNLRGNRVAPPPLIGYLGDQTENSYSYYAPPPYPGSSTVVHWTKLVPQGKAPTMWLVIVMRYVVAADGTLTPFVPDRVYLTCTEPRDHEHFEHH